MTQEVFIEGLAADLKPSATFLQYAFTSYSVNYDPSNVLTLKKFRKTDFSSTFNLFCKKIATLSAFDKTFIHLFVLAADDDSIFCKAGFRQI